MDRTTFEDERVKAALAGYVKVKFQARTSTRSPPGPDAEVRRRRLPTYVISGRRRDERTSPPVAPKPTGRPSAKAEVRVRAPEELPRRAPPSVSTLVKLAITAALYVAVSTDDVDKIWARLQAVSPAGSCWASWSMRAASAQRLAVVAAAAARRLDVPYLRMVAFYFIGMFFNIFLPTIVGAMP